MGDYRIRTFLKEVADNLTVSEVTHLKHLCSSYVGISFLERAKDGIDLFILLLQQDLIRKDDLSFLRDILRQIHRIDLTNKVEKFMKYPEGRMESESAVPSRVAGPQTYHSAVDPYRILLKKVSDELTSKNVADIKFVVNLPEGKKESMRDGNSLLSTLETCDMIGPSNLDLLEQLLDLAQRKDLSNKISQFKRDKYKPQTPGQRPTRQPSEHVILPGQTNRPPLLTPGHFNRKSSGSSTTSPITTTPVGAGDAAPVFIQVNPAPGLREVYPINNVPRGWCLIISNEHFNPGPDASRLLTNREGTDVDVKHLKDTFEQLKFKVLIKSDLTASEMYRAANDMARINHDNFDCFICCILSHGALGSIYGSDCLPIPVKDITSQFTGYACPSLASKPKLFFIQACRGEDRDKGASIQATDAVEMDEDDAIRNSAEPQESHFLLGYATPPGYVSWRSTVHGSWYISKLCECLSQYSNTDHLMDIMLEVNRQVSEAYTSKGFKQCPAPVVTLTKKVYLKT